MSYDDEYDGPDEDEQSQQTDRNPLRAQVRKMEKELKALREEAATGKQAARELQFAKAGVPLDDPKARYFVKGYDGELTAEAIKAAAAEIGLVDAPAQKQADIPAEEKAAHQRIADTTTGAGTPGGRDFNAEMNTAESEADLMRLYKEAGGLLAQGTYVPNQ